MSNEIHVQIPNVNHLRMNLLQCAKKSTELLQKFEILKKVRKEKKLLRNNLRNKIKEINSLFEELELKDLPDHKSIEEKTKKEQEKSTIEGIKKDQLTIELEEIENRLKDLEL